MSARLALVLAALTLVAPAVARADCTTTPQLCGLAVTSTIEQPDYDEAIDVVLVGDGFTTASDWATAAASAIATFKSQSQSGVYGTVPNLYNFHVVSVVSATANVSNTDLTDTALGMVVSGGFITADEARVSTAALNAPDVDVIIAIANGSGRANANYPSGLASGGRVRLGSSAAPISHELGHALIHLADEYVEAGLCTSTSEVSVLLERNVTADPTCTRFSTTPGAGCVQGAKYCATGMYRSASACLMATSGNVGTCPVCGRSVREVLVEKLTGIDQAEPWAVPVNPAAGSTVAGSVRLSAVLYDDTFSPTTVSFSIDGVFRGRVVTTSTSAQLDFDSTRLADGAHTFAVFPDDAVGHAGRSTTITFQTQNFTASPAVLALQNPVDGAVVSGKVYLSGSVTSGPTPAWLALTIDGVAVALVAEARSVSFAWDSTLGVHSLQLVAADHAQTQLSSAVVHVTGVAPPMDGGSGGSTEQGGLHVYISSPTSWAGVGASFLLDYSMFGATAPVTEELWLDGNRVMPNPLTGAFATGTNQKRALINSTAWTLGPHLVEVRASSAGTSASAVVAVVRVAAPSSPTALLVSPAAYAMVRGQVSASLLGLDDVSVSSLALLVDGAQVGSAPGPSATLAWDTTTVVDGNRTLVARATDGAGNQGSSTPISVQVDNTAPQVTITTPRMGDTVPAGLGAVVFTIVELGSGVADVSLFVDGQLALTGPLTSALPATLTAGGHDLAVQVSDRAGNLTRSATVHVTAGNCTTATCNDGNACTTDTCGTTGACLHVPTPGCCTSATDCNDGDSCTTDACGGGTCTHVAVASCCNFGATCSDGQLCTLDACSGVGGVCSHAAAGCCATVTDCDDGNSCTADTCLAAGWCAHDWNGQCCRTSSDCDDRNSCTTDTCNQGSCTHAAAAGCCNTSSDCDDGQPCTLNQCVNHVCAFPPSAGCCTTAADCASLNPCQVGACTAGRCTYSPTASGCCTFAFECDDRDACTLDACRNGTCAHLNSCCTQASQCDDLQACTTDSCNLDAGTLDAGMCSFNPIAGCCVADGDCDDLDVCTTDTCLNGSCAHPQVGGCCHSAADCDDADGCTTDGCSSSHACTHQNTCCTVAADCDDGNACTAEACDAGACVSAAVPGCCLADTDCDDHDACSGDRCTSNLCQHVALCCTSGADCADDDPCTIDACDGGQCSNAPLECAANETCRDGQCLPPAAAQVVGSCGCGATSTTPLFLFAAWLAARRFRRRVGTSSAA